MSHPNDATHPRELPNPADEAAFFAAVDARRQLKAGAAWRVREGEELAFETVTVTNEGRFLVFVHGGSVELQPHQVVEVCGVCEEPATDADPLGHFRYPAVDGEYVIAHGQCGEDHELELA